MRTDAISKATEAVLAENGIELPGPEWTKDDFLEIARGTTKVTDGVTDAQDKAGQPFTKGRLEQLLAEPFSTAEELIHSWQHAENLCAAHTAEDVAMALERTDDSFAALRRG